MGGLIDCYNTLKKTFPDCIVWINIGGFVQTFNGDAILTSSICTTEVVYREEEKYNVTGFKESQLNDFLKIMASNCKK